MEKLQRQRVLMQEHLRWLDSEIANEASLATSIGTNPTPAATTPAMAPVADALSPATAPSLSPALPEVPEPNIQGLHNEVRSGCLLYFGIAALALGLVIAFVYWRY